MNIEIDDPERPDVFALLEAHLRHMHELSPPESVHALDVSQLKLPDITFWTAREEEDLLGCGALKQLSEEHGEIKSMRTQPQHRGKGVGEAILQQIIAEAKSRGYTKLSLETGPENTFGAAHRLYQRFGFIECEPFANYQLDPFSVYMTLELGHPAK